MNVNVYQYIAYSTPDAAYDICKKYGYYDLRCEEDLAYCLQSIVARKGESAFQEIMEIHPDKGAILELFEKPTPLPTPIPLQMPEKDCSCMKNADGSNSSNASNIASQTNLMILAAAIVVSISIISMKK
jgi:hypothetical protein